MLYPYFVSVRLTDPGSSTTDPQEQTESSDSESIYLVDDISRSPEVNIAIPRPRPRVSRDPETTVPKNNDAVHNATNMVCNMYVPPINYCLVVFNFSANDGIC